MTIGAWIVFAFIAFCIIVCAFLICGIFDSPLSSAVIMIITFVLLIGIASGMCWYYQNTESGKRAVKDQESNFSGGIARRVNVYDMEGDLLASYEGTFDVEMSDTRILFDDDNGDRHIIYFTTGTVTIDEISGNGKE